MKTSNYLLLLLLIIGSLQSTAQQKSFKEISAGVHYARHGSGDMDGLLASFDLRKIYTSQLSIIYAAGFSLHGQKAYPGIDNINPSLPSDLQTQVPRWVTAGLQVSPLLSYKVNKKKTYGLSISGGPVLRYQLNGYPNAYQYIQNSPTFRQPFYVIRERDDHTLNIGYVLRISHQFKRMNRGAWSLNAFYQNDTNADLLVGLGLSYGFLFQ